MTDFPGQGQTTPWRDQLKAYIDERDAVTPAHTHTTAEIVGLTEAAQDAVAAMLAGASGVTLNYNDAANTLTITGPGTSSGLDAEAVRDAIGVALVGSNPLVVTVNDAADTITLSISPGYFALASHTHSIANVTNLQTTLDGLQSGKAPTSHSHSTSQVTGLDATLAGVQTSLTARMPTVRALSGGTWPAREPVPTIFNSIGLPGHPEPPGPRVDGDIWLED